MVRLRKASDEHGHDLDVQLQRIGQLQADLDSIRAAWLKATLARKSK